MAYGAGANEWCSSGVTPWIFYLNKWCSFVLCRKYWGVWFQQKSTLTWRRFGFFSWNQFHEIFCLFENARNIFCLRKPVIKCVWQGGIVTMLHYFWKGVIALHSGLKDLRKKLPKILCSTIDCTINQYSWNIFFYFFSWLCTAEMGILRMREGGCVLVWVITEKGNKHGGSLDQNCKRPRHSFFVYML